MTKKDVRSLSLEDLRAFFIDKGFKAFRGNQVYEWLWKKSITDIDQMTNISKEIRDSLKTEFVINNIKIDSVQKSTDGTIKNAIKLHDGLTVESVLIPTKTRMTACISSQVGCSLNCKFCATSRLKRMRNLNPDEIYDQVVTINNQCLEFHNKPLTNIVFMGMGEPLLNFDAVIESAKIMKDQLGYGLSRKRITISTAGIVPKIKKLNNYVDVSLAISLHASNDVLRDEIVPINKKYPIEKLLNACQDYLGKENKRKHVTIEYILIKKR